MKRRLPALGIALAMAGTAVAATPAAAAAVPCAKAADMRANLARQFDEVPVAAGLGANGALVEVFASANGSFTIVVTHPSGVSCLLAAGENFQAMWERLDKVKAGPAA